MDIGDLEKLFDAKLVTVHEKLDITIDQVKKTNGRVTKLEAWRNKIIGALVITEILMLPVAFMYISSLF